MDQRLIPIDAILKLNTRLFINCLEGVSDDMAQTRLKESTNNITFIACHVLDARYFIAGYLGLNVENPYKHLLEGVLSVDQLKEFPPIEKVRSHWHDISAVLANHFAKITSNDLEKASSQRFPVGERTVLGGIAFLMQHESYHIGQLALLRKFFGLAPMLYS